MATHAENFDDHALPLGEEKSESLRNAVPNVVQRNIDALVAARKDSDHRRTAQDHIADAVTTFSGSLIFVYLHVVWFASWIGWNIGLSRLEPFDPYPFGMLTTIVSLEAIFLSTFVLISQNRQAKIADRRADLNLQTDLLAEHEITRVLRVLEAVAKKLDVPLEGASGESELTKDVHPDEVLRQLEKAQEHAKY